MDRYYEIKEYLNLIMRDSLKCSYYTVDGDDTVFFINLYIRILTERNRANKGVALSIMYGYYDTKRVWTSKQLFGLESFKRLEYLTGEDMDAIYEHYC